MNSDNVSTGPHRRQFVRAALATAGAVDCLDYRVVLDRKGIDTVVTGTPDRWHVPITIAAVRGSRDRRSPCHGCRPMTNSGPLPASRTANSQPYIPYTQFGTINYTTNPLHSTYHSMIDRVFSSGFSANSVFTYSKNLVGGAGSGYTCYDRRLTKALAGNDRKLQFVNQLNYALPVGRGCRFLTRGGILNQIVEGWTFLTIQSIRSGLPASFSSAGSPFKYLPGGPPHRGLPAAPGRIEEFVNDQSPSSSRQSSR